ncbi:MAG: 4-(cytidine 5'-diphospho)-2-C-methyl-D-erythritol kinase, partial [Akkermansiaceae bacterium]
MPKETRKAPAKLNLTLRVLGKRDDGFHELESLMAPLGLCDELHFERADEYALTCDESGVPLDESNLVTKAVRLFERETGKACCWEIDLMKNIPHGAGLGGGSSDAATTLLAMNDLENTQMSLGKLASLAAEIGSDIPFFIYQQVCMIGGRGETVKPVEIEGLSGTPLLLLKPDFAVSTPDAYKNCLSAEPLHGVDYSAQRMPWGEIVNDLEQPVFYKHRFLAEMKVWLLDQPEVDAAMMSGSGSTMIAFAN